MNKRVDEPKEPPSREQPPNREQPQKQDDNPWVPTPPDGGGQAWSVPSKDDDLLIVPESEG